MRRSVLVLMGVLVASLGFGCRPKYPKCHKDSNCREREFCIKGTCQQCRNDGDCSVGERCNAGRCEAIPDYCLRSEDCPEDKACKENRCVACDADNDCGVGGHCKAGHCLRAGRCKTDADCPENHECHNGFCVAPPGLGNQPAACQPATVYFAFDESALTPETTQELQRAATCIRSVPRRALMCEGHTDPRGTEEYNLALGDRRARAVITYLERLGIETSRLRAASKGEVDAVGHDRSSWATDRKVVFVWE